MATVHLEAGNFQLPHSSQVPKLGYHLDIPSRRGAVDDLDKPE